MKKLSRPSRKEPHLADNGEDRGGRSGSPSRLGELDIEAHLADARRKQAFVTPMFNVIAPRYDAFTRIFSFGMDVRWKRDAVAAAVQEAPQARRGLDLACGTGDFTIALVRALPKLRMRGIDASPVMVQHGAHRVATTGLAGTTRDRIRLEVGDMMQLAADARSIDLITSGYGVRNVPDPATAVREMARVLRPGGTLITLDFYRPQFAPWRKALLAYLAVAGNAVGWAWHRDPVVYGYIARSIDHFMSWQAFSALLEQEGFIVKRVLRHLGGGIALHVATRR